MAGDSSKRAIVESVLRATRLLECFHPGEPQLSLAELVRRGGYSKTTTYRLLSTLELAGWLERASDGAFRLTFRPFQIGSILVDSLDLRQVALPVMRRLSADCGVTVYLTVAAGSDAVCIERVDRGKGVRVMDLQVGGTQPLHLGAAPRALLAFREQELLPALLRAGLELRTDRTLATADALVADLAEIRRRGYSISDGDVTPGVAALGAPVFDVRGRPIAAISIGGLSDQIIGPHAVQVDALLRASAEISGKLGAPPSPSRTDDQVV